MNELLAGIRQRLEGDRVLWGIALVLTVASLVTVYSAISTLAYKADGNSAKFLFKQVGLLSLGWLVMFGVHRIHFKYFREQLIPLESNQKQFSLKYSWLKKIKLKSNYCLKKII